MAKIQTSCPRCRQPVLAEIEQLFDMNNDPNAKNKILSGAANLIQCKACGYQGPLPTPMVYHDPEKELLLTFFPPELGMPLNEQEKTIGPLITQVMNRLPPEKRKAYLLQPKSMLTYQTLIDKILEGDGITREMVEAQQRKMSLLQRLLSLQGDSRLTVIEQEKAQIDEEFFVLMSRLVEISVNQGDKATAQALSGLQKDLIEKTEVGQKLQGQAKEVQATMKALQEAGKDGLTREKLIDLMMAAPSDVGVSTLVNYTYQALDYTFFQALTTRLEGADGEEKKKLTELREKLVDMTNEIKKAVEAEIQATQKQFETILASPDVEKATMEALETLSPSFADIVDQALQEARKTGNLERSAKIQQIAAVLEKASQPPAEIQFLEELLSAPDENAVRKMLEDKSA
ncbi:MAG TPA: CpXC domain-containing protein, partial [Longilinea sp.]|nr:CpXC domain-containing protein [Longilinea sp.]